MVIHPTAVIGGPPEHREWFPTRETFAPEIDEGVEINSFVTVDAGMREPTRIGARTFLMSKVHVGHDAQIGEDCELAPGVVICGHARIGDGVRIGANACVRPFIQVGDGARIGMGAVVVKDVPAGEVWAGNPARRLESRPEPEWQEWYDRSRATCPWVGE